MKSSGGHRTSTVACFGEIIWDAMPQGLFIGGAPFNVAYHLMRLGQPALVISSIGRDELGRQALRKAEAYGMDLSCIQISDTHPTGVSDIEFNESNDATYEIKQPAAWDAITHSELLQEKLIGCSALVFGTLASRSSVTRNTLTEILDTFQGLTVCDVNLRKPHDDRDRALKLAERAQVVKLNEQELYELCDADPSSSSLEEALKTFEGLVHPSMTIVTRGGDPAVYFDGERTVYASPPGDQNVVDTVGAGDAFTAALVKSLLGNAEIEECLDAAVRLGSFVASQQGAQPDYDPTHLYSKPS